MINRLKQELLLIMKITLVLLMISYDFGDLSKNVEFHFIIHFVPLLKILEGLIYKKLESTLNLVKTLVIIYYIYTALLILSTYKYLIERVIELIN